jgi:hypothetical protein
MLWYAAKSFFMQKFSADPSVAPVTWEDVQHGDEIKERWSLRNNSTHETS